MAPQRSSTTDRARAAFRSRFASDDDYRLYMRGLASRPRKAATETLRGSAARRGVSVSTERRYRQIEQHPDLVAEINGGRMTKAAALREASLRSLPYEQQLSERQGRPTAQEAASTLRAIVAGDIDLARVMLALVPDPAAPDMAQWLAVAEMIKQLRDDPAAR